MIIFENEGLMPLEAATTFGINVKLGENPIGFFGTGLKYAIAITLRLGGTFRLFLGEVEYEFYVKDADFRGKEFGFIRMKKRKSLLGRWSYEKLAYTTELGKHWEPWMAVRELESNTRDENGQSALYSSPYSIAKQLFPIVDRTVIMIECPEMEEAFENLGDIFMPEKELLAEIGPLKIYKGHSKYIFFRGLRVTDLTKASLFTYNFDLGITLTEDRTSKWPASDNYRIMEAIMKTSDQAIIDKVMDAKEDDWYEGTLHWDQPLATAGTNFYAAMGLRIHSGGILPKRMRTYYKSLQIEDDPNEKFKVMLTREQIERIRSVIDDKEINAAFEKALDTDDGVPF